MSKVRKSGGRPESGTASSSARHPGGGSRQAAVLFEEIAAQASSLIHFMRDCEVGSIDAGAFAGLMSFARAIGAVADCGAAAFGGSVSRESMEWLLSPAAFSALQELRADVTDLTGGAA